MNKLFATLLAAAFATATIAPAFAADDAKKADTKMEKKADTKADTKMEKKDDKKADKK